MNERTRAAQGLLSLLADAVTGGFRHHIRVT